MSSEPKSDHPPEKKRRPRRPTAGAKVRLAMGGALPTAVASGIAATVQLLLTAPTDRIPASPLFIPLIVLVLFQLNLGLSWLIKRENVVVTAPWSLGLALSALASGTVWGIAAAAALQPPAGNWPLLPALLAAFAHGLHFAPLGLQLLLFLLALCGGLLLSGAGGVPLPEAIQTLLTLFAVSGSAAVLAQFALAALVSRAWGDLDLLRQENLHLQESGNTTIQQLQEAEHDCKELEDALVNAKQAAQSADVKKNEFLAIMSHEIRTPLNGILPLLEILGGTQLNREQRQLVNTAHNSSRHLLRIINDILDFSKIEAGKLELEQVELSIKGLIESVTGLMGNMAEKRHIRLSQKIASQVPDRLRGDPLRLRQILSNLVSNAVKFTEKGHISVEVSAYRSRQREVEVLFMVRDTGVGMDHDTVRRLFSSFTQADASTTRKYGGTGLGLVICKRLVNMMGGQIGVRSKLGKGSIFWFVIPMRRPLGEVPAGRESLENARALLVGLEERDYQEISGHLRGWGVTFSRAEDVREAISSLNSAATLGDSWAQDLVILEPERLGHACKALVQEIHHSPRLRHTAIIAVVSDPALGPPLLERGVGDVLTRPVRAPLLQQSLHRLLDVRSDDRHESQLLARSTPVIPILEQDILDRGEPESRLTATLAPPRPVSDAVALSGNVLLVEDNDVNRAVARRLLERIGLRVDEAIDGQQALHQVEHNDYDLVLMDCRMPNKDGYEATGEIRARERRLRLPRLPVIAMTANAMAGDKEKCLSAGMDDYLPKPVNRELLAQMMSKWIKPRRKGPTITPRPTQPAAKEKPMSDVTDEQPIDMNIINELKEVMEDDFTRLLESYITNVPPLYTQLRNAAVANDIVGMVSPAHSIKSSSANVGAMKVSEAAKAIEMAARGNNGEAAKSAFQLLNKSLPPAIKALSDMVRAGR